MTLISRLEAATGPDRELDAEIYASVVRRDLADTRTAGHGVSGKNQFYEAGGDGKGWHYAPAYTGSLDAAMTLVPEDLWWLIGKGNIRDDEPLYGAQALNRLREVVSDGEHDANPAIALCIAALKAMNR